MMRATTIPAARMAIEYAPTLTQIQAWWEDLQHDPVKTYGFTDLMPDDLDIFMESAVRGAMVPTVFLGSEGEVLGAFWLHDYGIANGHAYTWCGTYIRPQYRHAFSAAIGRGMREVCRTYGYRTIFVACRHSNRAAQGFAERAFGLYRLGVYPHWAPFEGELDDVVLFTARRGDQELCWRIAEQRAVVFRKWAETSGALAL